MATTTTTLQALSIAAEDRLAANPTKVFRDTATATALDATLTPNTGQFAQVARLLRLTLSYSAAPAVSVLTVEDGSTVIWQVEISATGPFVYDFDFSNCPLRATAGAVLHAKVGSAGGAVVQTLSCIGDLQRQN